MLTKRIVCKYQIFEELTEIHVNMAAKLTRTFGFPKSRRQIIY